ncbi:gamma-aminobutyric acid receptor subunit beta-like [Watersipora subatra]|uniref:gamma-aminobutyric acid receptor subunit beta-like n=1 Tax=Watersipora subatra TaxID=2589382 RepID=UPI00355B2585
MDYTITMYLNQYWKDERLVYGTYDEQMTLTGDFAEKIWVPDTFFANDKHSFLHEVTEKNKMIRLGGDGSIAYGMRFTTTLACMMDLHYYPLDIQNCTVEIESYGYPMEDVEMRWRVGRNSIVGADDVDLPQFSLIGYNTLSTIQVLASGKYQRLSLSFLLKRHIGYFVFQTFLPSILIVMLSWVSFWINHEATSARVALGITTVLTMTTISTGVRASLPRISYVKAIDIYLVICFVFVFVALLEYAAVNYFFWGARAKKKKKTKDKTGMALGTNSLSSSNYMATYSGQTNGRATMINEERKLNEDGAIELTELVPDEPQVSNSYPYPNTAGDESDNMLKTNNRGSSNNNHGEFHGSLADTMPRQRKQSGYAVRGTNPRNKRVWVNFKQRAKEIKGRIPQVKDVNNIDKYSRLMFPLLFVVFNAWYWVYYSVLSEKEIE